MNHPKKLHQLISSEVHSSWYVFRTWPWSLKVFVQVGISVPCLESVFKAVIHSVLITLITQPSNTRYSNEVTTPSTSSETGSNSWHQPHQQSILNFFMQNLFQHRISQLIDQNTDTLSPSSLNFSKMIPSLNCGK